MRSVNSFVKVEGHASLIRDMSSNAIISIDDNEFNAYRKRREAEKNRIRTQQQQANDIERLKNDMDQIKSMLSQLLSAKGIDQ